MSSDVNANFATLYESQQPNVDEEYTPPPTDEVGDFFKIFPVRKETELTEYEYQDSTKIDEVHEQQPLRDEIEEFFKIFPARQASIMKNGKHANGNTPKILHQYIHNSVLSVQPNATKESVLDINNNASCVPSNVSRESILAIHNSPPNMQPNIIEESVLEEKFDSTFDSSIEPSINFSEQKEKKESKDDEDTETDEDIDIDILSTKKVRKRKSKKFSQKLGQTFHFEPSKHSKFLYHIAVAAYAILDIIAIVSIIIALKKTILNYSELNIVYSKNEENILPYSNAKYFWANESRNPYGEWYGFIILSHASFAVILLISIFIPLFVTLVGSFFHQLYGALSITLLYIVMMTGMFPTALMFYSRGFTPCAYSQYSFPLLLYIHFIYWLFWMSESICYAISAVLFRRMRFPKIIKYVLFCMSIFSISGAVFRVLYLLILVVSYGGKIQCITLSDTIVNGCLYLVEMPTTIFSVLNIKYVLRNYGTYSSTEWRMCHNRNIILVCFLIFWTLMANIAYKTVPILAVCAYILGSCLLFVGIIFFKRLKSRQHRGAILQTTYYSTNMRSSTNPFADMHFSTTPRNE